MITIRFFGSLRINHQIKELRLSECTVKQAVDAVIKRYPTISKEELLKSIMMVNHTPLTKNNRFSLQLKTGDELVFLSPVAGG